MRLLTDPATLPPCVLMRSSAASRERVGRTPVRTKERPPKMPTGGESGALAFFLLLGPLGDDDDDDDAAAPAALEDTTGGLVSSSKSLSSLPAAMCFLCRIQCVGVRWAPKRETLKNVAPKSLKVPLLTALGALPWLAKRPWLMELLARLRTPRASERPMHHRGEIQISRGKGDIISHLWAFCRSGVCGRGLLAAIRRFGLGLASKKSPNVHF